MEPEKIQKVPEQKRSHKTAMLAKLLKRKRQKDADFELS